ncbi:MAG: hypothetical protein LQ349_007919 [Xanthoria aureola]|nr:MAG: hypothetical protein LQ349_007919 [Xanthoria aureola]
MLNWSVQPLFLFSLSFLAVRADGEVNNTQAAAAKQIRAWQDQYNNYIFEALANRTSGCTYDKLQYRREWSSLSPKQRSAYTTAVECLQSKPNLISNIRVPGARTRFDDVVAAHIFQAPYIHFSGIFLHWHRYYTYLYDKLLRTECGYTGPQPYWDWTLTYADPLASKIFSGTADSMGSNGIYIPNRNGTFTNAFNRPRTIPAATGGGCVTSGPFQNYTVNLGPASYEPRVGSGTGLDYNPRCLKRDVSLEFSHNLKPTDVVALIGANAALEAFSGFFETRDGLHASGHFTIGGDPGNDGFVSAGDPIFYLHHGQVDRLWTIWQALGGGGRFGEVFGTSTAFNRPPSPNVTLDYELQYEVLSEPVTMRSVDSTIDGPFCYIYI